MTQDEQLLNAQREVRRKREKLAEQSTKKHKRQVYWKDGVLMFLGTNDPVPDVQAIPKAPSDVSRREVISKTRPQVFRRR